MRGVTLKNGLDAIILDSGVVRNQAPVRPETTCPRHAEGIRVVTTKGRARRSSLPFVREIATALKTRLLRNFNVWRDRAPTSPSANSAEGMPPPLRYPGKAPGRGVRGQRPQGRSRSVSVSTHVVAHDIEFSG